MGFMDKLRNRLQMVKGRGKREAGQATGDPYLAGKGEAERMGGAGRQAGEQAKDAARDVRDSFR